MALLAAVEMWVRRDHEAERKEWERRLQVIEDAVADVESITFSRHVPERSNVSPVMHVDWDAEKVGHTSAEVAAALSEGEPRIEVFHHATGVSFNPYMMEEGDDSLVAPRLREILTTR